MDSGFSDRRGRWRNRNLSPHPIRPIRSRLALRTQRALLGAPSQREYTADTGEVTRNPLQRAPEATGSGNGTLRHHLMVLVNERSVTIVPVNGRTCYYAGAPAQVEILEGTGVTDQATAAAMLPVGLSGVQRKIVTRLSNSPNPPSQAQLARDMGKSRTTVNSALGILRKRGIVNQGTLSLAPHLDGLGMSKVVYPWLEIRQEYA